MSVKPVPEPMAETFRAYFNVEDPEGLDALKELLDSIKGKPRPPDDWTEPFRNQLAMAILNDSISPEQYEDLTGEDFDSQEELRAWLLNVWKHLYGDDPVTVLRH